MKYEKPQQICFDQRFLVQGRAGVPGLAPINDVTSCLSSDPEATEFFCDIFGDPDND